MMRRRLHEKDATARFRRANNYNTQPHFGPPQAEEYSTCQLNCELLTVTPGAHVTL